MSNKYEEDIRKLFISVVNKDEADIKIIEKLTKEMKWQIGSELSHLLMAYVALIDEKEGNNKKNVQVEDIIKFSNDIEPELKLKMYPDVYIYHRCMFLKKKIEKEMKGYETTKIREIPFDKVLECTGELIKIYENVNEYGAYSLEDFQKEKDNFKRLIYTDKNVMEKIGKFILDINVLNLEIKIEESDNSKSKYIIESYYFDYYNYNEEKQAPIYETYFDEKDFKKKYAGLNMGQIKELIVEYFHKEKKELMKMIEVTENDLVFFNWIGSLPKIKLENDLNHVFKKYPDPNKIFNNIGKEIQNYLTEEKIKNNFEKLNNEVCMGNNEVNIKVRGKI